MGSLRTAAALHVVLVTMIDCSPPKPQSCTELALCECIADTRRHEVWVTKCDTLEDCPVGSRCLEATDDSKMCRVPAEPVSDRDELFSKFGVDRMSAQLTGEKGARLLDWSAPESTRLVVCALFHCAPVVGDVDGVAAIINFDRCAVARGDWTRTAGQFNLRDPDAAWQPDNEEPATDACEQTVDIPVIETLLAGCWAYDNWGLIAASELLRIPPSEVYDYRDNLARDSGHCASGDDGRSCLLDSGSYGTCVDIGESLPSCRPRCLFHDDCRALCSDDAPDSLCSNGSSTNPDVVLGTCGPCVASP